MEEAQDGVQASDLVRAFECTHQVWEEKTHWKLAEILSDQFLQSVKDRIRALGLPDSCCCAVDYILRSSVLTQTLPKGASLRDFGQWLKTQQESLSVSPFRSPHQQLGTPSRTTRFSKAHPAPNSSFQTPEASSSDLKSVAGEPEKEVATGGDILVTPSSSQGQSRRGNAKGQSTWSRMRGRVKAHRQGPRKRMFSRMEEFSQAHGEPHSTHTMNMGSGEGDIVPGADSPCDVSADAFPAKRPCEEPTFSADSLLPSQRRSLTQDENCAASTLLSWRTNLEDEDEYHRPQTRSSRLQRRTRPPPLQDIASPPVRKRSTRTQDAAVDMEMEVEEVRNRAVATEDFLEDPLPGGSHETSISTAAAAEGVEETEQEEGLEGETLQREAACPASTHAESRETEGGQDSLEGDQGSSSPPRLFGSTGEGVEVDSPAHAVREESIVNPPALKLVEQQQQQQQAPRFPPDVSAMEGWDMSEHNSGLDRNPGVSAVQGLDDIPLKKGHWSKEEDDILMRAVEEYKGRQWRLVARNLPNRSSVQCRHRYASLQVTHKGPWTAEEDRKLTELVMQHGPKRWSQIARHIDGRAGKMCRERWLNHLDPTINRTPWTPEEDATIISAVRDIGTKWAKIAVMLEGRRDNAIKNRWNSTLRRLQRSSKQQHQQSEAGNVLKEEEEEEEEEEGQGHGDMRDEKAGLLASKPASAGRRGSGSGATQSNSRLSSETKRGGRTPRSRTGAARSRTSLPQDSPRAGTPPGSSVGVGGTSSNSTVSHFSPDAGMMGPVSMWSAQPASSHSPFLSLLCVPQLPDRRATSPHLPLVGSNACTSSPPPSRPGSSHSSARTPSPGPGPGPRLSINDPTSQQPVFLFPSTSVVQEVLRHRPDVLAPSPRSPVLPEQPPSQPSPSPDDEMGDQQHMSDT